MLSHLSDPEVIWSSSTYAPVIDLQHPLPRLSINFTIKHLMYGHDQNKHTTQVSYP